MREARPRWFCHDSEKINYLEVTSTFKWREKSKKLCKWFRGSLQPYSTCNIRCHWWELVCLCQGQKYNGLYFGCRLNYEITTKKEKKSIIIKLDLEKAYYYTDWDFLDYVMVCKGSEIGFDSSHFSILLNESPKRLMLCFTWA